VLYVTQQTVESIHDSNNFLLTFRPTIVLLPGRPNFRPRPLSESLRYIGHKLGRESQPPLYITPQSIQLISLNLEALRKPRLSREINPLTAVKHEFEKSAADARLGIEFLRFDLTTTSRAKGATDV